MDGGTFAGKTPAAGNGDPNAWRTEMWERLENAREVTFNTCIKVGGCALQQAHGLVLRMDRERWM